MQSLIFFTPLIFSFMIFSSSAAYADFEMNKDYCFISTQFNLEHEGEKLPAVFQMSVSATEDIGMPIANVSFSSGINVDSARLLWSNPKITNRNKNPIFSEAFTNKINSSTKIFNLYKNDGDIFYSPFYGYLKWKIFMTLFLSQRDMTIEYKLKDDSKFYKMPISLSGSDQAVRDMAVNCYQGLSKDYLNEYTTRKKNLAQSWMDAYGLTKYTGINLNKELDYVLKDKFKDDVLKTYDFFKTLYPLLKQRNKFAQEIAHAEQDSNAKDQIDLIKSKISKIKSLSERLITIEGDGTNGLIQKSRDKILKIKLQIQKLKQNISKLKNNDLNNLKQNLHTLSSSNSRKMKQLEIYETKIQNLQDQIDDSQKTLVYLDSVYNLIATKLDQKRLNQIKNKGLSNSTPLILEEIKQRSQTALDQELEIENLKLILDSLLEIRSVLQTSLSKYKTALDEYQKYLKSEKTITDLEYKIETEQIKIYNIHNSINNVKLKDLKVFNQKIENKNPNKDRLISEEKAWIISMLKELNAAYDANLENLVNNERPVTYQVLCHSDIFSKQPKPYCLTPLDLKSDKAIMYYFNKITSFKLDDIIIRSQLDHSFPWRDEKNRTKPEVLISSLNQEIKGYTNLKIYQDQWNRILTLRWQYSQIKAKNSDLRINGSFYKKKLQDLELSIDSKRNKIDKNSRKIKAEKIKAGKIKKSYLKLERAYQEEKENLVADIQTRLSELKIKNSRLSECLMNLFDIHSCQTQFNNFVEKTKLNKNKQIENFKNNVEVLFYSLLLNTQEVRESLQTKNKSLKHLTQDMKEYKTKTNIEALLEKQTNLEAKKAELLTQVNDLQTDISESQEIKTNMKLKVSSLEDEKQKIKKNLQKLKIELGPIKRDLNSYCTKQRNLYRNLKAINKKIISLGGELNTIGLETSPCQIIENMVLD